MATAPRQARHSACKSFDGAEVVLGVPNADSKRNWTLSRRISREEALALFVQLGQALDVDTEALNALCAPVNLEVEPTPDPLLDEDAEALTVAGASDG